MKCPNCGAETTEKICEFCGTEMPQEKTSINITNNYYGNTPEQNTSEQNNDSGKCPKCGSSKITFSREKIGTTSQSNYYRKPRGKVRTDQYVSQSTYRTVGLCQSCGYTWSPNMKNMYNNAHSSDKKIWLWILGWICIFPVPLTILLLRKKDMKPELKYAIIAVAWIVYLMIGLFGRTQDTQNVKETTSHIENVQEIQYAEEVPQGKNDFLQKIEIVGIAGNEVNVDSADSYNQIIKLAITQGTAC